MTFDRLVDVKRLRECLASGTGKGVSVGILDSGVDCRLPDLNGSVVGNYELRDDVDGRTNVVSVERGNPVTEHGTACAHIIHRLAPDAELHSIRVLGPSHNSTSPRLLASLEFAVEQDWDILNLSLGTQTSHEELARLADRAYYQGMLWIAARDNKREDAGFPAALSSVVGVDMEFFEDPTDFRFHHGRAIEIEASGVYVDAPTPGGGRQQFTGSSFACPQVAGLAARLREHFPDLTPFQLKTALVALRENQEPDSS